MLRTFGRSIVKDGVLRMKLTAARGAATTWTTHVSKDEPNKIILRMTHDSSGKQLNEKRHFLGVGYLMTFLDSEDDVNYYPALVNTVMYAREFIPYCEEANPNAVYFRASTDVRHMSLKPRPTSAMFESTSRPTSPLYVIPV